MDLYGRVLRDVLYPAWEGMRGRPTMELTRYLKRTEWWSADELEVLQAGFLRRLLRHAYLHTPFYRERLDAAGLRPEDVRSTADLARLPVLTRDQARASAESRTSTAPPFAVVTKATSGSTGQPITILSYNAESRHWRDATRWRGYGWAGYLPGMKALHFWGFGAVPPPTRIGRWKVAADHLLKRDLYVDCTPRGDDHLAQVVATIKAEQPSVIVTYSQAGAALARYVLRTDARAWGTIPVLCGAERLYDHDRAAMQKAFGPDVFETYGAREFMLMASECGAHDGLHVSMETMIVEVLVRQPDGSMRAALPGEVGELAVTDLHNLAMPFVRYLNGDLATARKAERCSCGRFLTRIGPIEGRVTDTLRDGRGNPVSGLTFNILFVTLAEHAREFQAIQHLDGSLTLKVVPIGELPASMHQLVEQFTGKYLPGVKVTIAIVDDIPPTKAGKRQVVIVEKPGTAAAPGANGQ